MTQKENMLYTVYDISPEKGDPLLRLPLLSEKLNAICPLWLLKNVERQCLGVLSTLTLYLKLSEMIKSAAKY